TLPVAEIIGAIGYVIASAAAPVAPVDTSPATSSIFHIALPSAPNHGRWKALAMQFALGLSDCGSARRTEARSETPIRAVPEAGRLAKVRGSSGLLRAALGPSRPFRARCTRRR